MTPIGDFQIVDHGVEHEQYFQGCGTAFTNYENVVTGIGDNFAEAIDDCLESIAQCDFETDGMEKRILDDIGKSAMPKRPKVKRSDSDECHYYVSIRWNKEAQA